ncbi:hypothetical protein ABEB36_010275 [Hypothenemus hampei]|uniref:Tudor domain-containing protein n=1 Tax=Hypothenemus hampei TaxID=57062 RepID=A0ABD1EJ56_HYPHA
MAQYQIRQLLAWSLPSVAVLLSYLWYKKKRIGAASDTGGPKPIDDHQHQQQQGQEFEGVSETTRSEEIQIQTPVKINRSLSGVETSPIDIVYPKQFSKSCPVVISDEDLDLEIEKVKSLRTNYTSPTIISERLKTPSTTPTSSTPMNVENDAAPSKTPPVDPSLKTPIREPFEHCVVVSTKKETPKQTPTKKFQGKKQEKTSAKKMGAKDTVEIKNNEVVKKESPKKEIKKDTKQKEEQQKGHRELHRKNSGRDSANHSPCDVIIASPSLSSMSDNHSEGSSDSGKGGSEMATPPPSRTPQLTVDPNAPSTYDFVIPQNLVGKLIGIQGSFVQSIKDKCNAQVFVRRHPTNNRLKVCSIDGSHLEIAKALRMIRNKFPVKKYSEITLEQIHLTPIVPTVPLIPDYLYLKLIEGINNDTILSCMVTPNHLFMQQPTHPSFPNLATLNHFMNICYNGTESPFLPTPIPENTVCVAHSVDLWYRAMVLSSDEESGTSYVKFLDYGGYAYVENTKLRQIRQDFMLLPFQAAECFLANITPKTEDGSWPDDAYSLVANITKGSIIYTQIADYTTDGIPLVLCYVIPNPKQVIFLNQSLVEEGFAEWLETSIEEQQTPVEEEKAVVESQVEVV